MKNAYSQSITKTLFSGQCCRLQQILSPLVKAKRCSRFIVKCLNSSNSIVRFVAGQGVLHQRMHSPIGRNAQHSATLLGTPLSKLASINKKMAWTTVNNRVMSDSDFSNMNVIRESLYIKHNFADMTLDLDLDLESNRQIPGRDHADGDERRNYTEDDA